MAISFTKQPTGVYPVFNESYIEFTSTLANNNRATITLNENLLVIGDYFEIYPNKDGVYQFNLKEIISEKLTQNGFVDQWSETPSNQNINTFGETIDGSYLSQELTIRVYSNITNESVIKTYNFFKYVVQVGEGYNFNTSRICNPSKNKFDYNITYFEGYPFAMDMMRVSNNIDISIKNNNTGFISDTISTSELNTFRLYVDTGTSNWTTQGFLPLNDILNRLEIRAKSGLGTFVTSNVNLKKISSKCGVYLKWFNNQGGYSYFLFDEFYKNNIKSNQLKLISNNQFNNANELKNLTSPIGKEGYESLVINANVDENESYFLKNLFTSPSVQMWSQNEPFIEGEWIDVELSGSYETNNKSSKNKITVTLDLPKLLTPTL